MKRKTLQPEQIIVPGEYDLGNEAILKIYFRIFDKGHGKSLPPAIVANSNYFGEKERNSRLYFELVNRYKWFQRQAKGWFTDLTGKESVEDLVGMMTTSKANSIDINTRNNLNQSISFYRKLNEIARLAPYYLIDGNHKTTAATLARKPIYALELQKDSDLEKIRKMVYKGELFNFNSEETSLKNLVLDLENYLLHNIDKCRTIRERINRLTFNRDLPQYMIDKYKKGI